MMRKVILAGAALIGLAISTPAQIHIEGRLGRHVRVHAHVGRAHSQNAPRPVARHRGHWQNVYHQVWVPGCYREQYVPARYGWVYDACGRARWEIIEPACTRSVWVPGCYQTPSRRVWVR